MRIEYLLPVIAIPLILYLFLYFRGKVKLGLHSSTLKEKEWSVKLSILNRGMLALNLHESIIEIDFSKGASLSRRISPGMIKPGDRNETHVRETVITVAYPLDTIPDEPVSELRLKYLRYSWMHILFKITRFKTARLRIEDVNQINKMRRMS